MPLGFKICSPELLALLPATANVRVPSASRLGVGTDPAEVTAEIRVYCVPCHQPPFFFSPSRSILNYFPNFLQNGRLCPLPFVKLWGPSGVCCWQRKTACGICCKYFMFGQNHASVCVCVCVLCRPAREALKQLRENLR